MTAELEDRASLPAWGPPAGLACPCWHAKARHAGACRVEGCPCPGFRLSMFSIFLAVTRRLRRLLP